MGSIGSFNDDATSCNNNKLLESIQYLRTLLSNNTDLCQPLVGTSIPDSSWPPLPDYDLSLLDSPTLLHSMEQPLLLPSPSSHYNSISHLDLDQTTEKWSSTNCSLEMAHYYSLWKFKEPSEQPNFLQDLVPNPNPHLNLNPNLSHPPPSKDGTLNSILIPLSSSKHCEENASKSQVNKLTEDDAAIPCINPKPKRSPLIPNLDWVSQEASASDPLKQMELSDASDLMDDDEDESNHGSSLVSKNLLSERRRRQKLNKRLYLLRAIVPKITKMDKASIVGDAITYVQDLERQVEEMQEDIKKMQAIKDSLSSEMSGKNQEVKPFTDAKASVPFKAPDNKVFEVVVLYMEEQTYHLQIHSKKGPSVLVQVTRALECLDFEIVSANLTSVSEHVFHTIIVKVKNGKNIRAEDLRKIILDVIPSFGLHL